MASRPRNLFLYLALACLFGLMAIFVVDGYMGIYDTVYITAGEQEQKIEPDFRLKDDTIWWTAGANWGEKVFFRYEIDNRQFSSYSADIEVSVWRSQQKVLDLGSFQVLVDAFDQIELEWVVDTAELEPVSFDPEQTYEYTVLIKKGEEERRIILHLNYPPYPTKTPPPPSR